MSQYNNHGQQQGGLSAVQQHALSILLHIHTIINSSYTVQNTIVIYKNTVYYIRCIDTINYNMQLIQLLWYCHYTTVMVSSKAW